MTRCAVVVLFVALAVVACGGDAADPVVKIAWEESCLCPVYRHDVTLAPDGTAARREGREVGGFVAAEFAKLATVIAAQSVFKRDAVFGDRHPHVTLVSHCEEEPPELTSQRDSPVPCRSVCHMQTSRVFLG